MGKALLLMPVYIPLLLGLLASSERNPRRALRKLLLSWLAFALLYAFFLYYVFMRVS